MVPPSSLNTIQAAKALGISKSTLLRLFRAGKVQEVGRDRNNWRVFSERDLARIRRVLEATTR